MRDQTVTLQELPRALEALEKEIHGVILRAAVATSEKAVPVIQGKVPVAFGDLKNSVHATTGPKTVVDAPHAGAVEVGSAPHSPDLQKLIAWVRLRAMQGLGDTSKLSGHTSAAQATQAASSVKAHERHGVNPIDTPERIARAIAKSIEHHGTKPHWFAQSSLPQIRDILDTEIKQGLGK